MTVAKVVVDSHGINTLVTDVGYICRNGEHTLESVIYEKNLSISCLFFSLEI